MPPLEKRCERQPSTTGALPRQDLVYAPTAPLGQALLSPFCRWGNQGSLLSFRY